MSQQYEKNNRGVLFKNEDKQQYTHADYRGNITVDGKEYWLDCWIKKSKAGKNYMSLSVKLKQPRNGATPRRDEVPGPKNDAPFDDDLPF